MKQMFFLITLIIILSLTLSCCINESDGNLRDYQVTIDSNADTLLIKYSGDNIFYTYDEFPVKFERYDAYEYNDWFYFKDIPDSIFIELRLYFGNKYPSALVDSLTVFGPMDSFSVSATGTGFNVQ